MKINVILMIPHIFSFVLIAAPVGLDEGFGIAPDAAQHAGPGLTDGEQSAAGGRDFVAVIVEDGGIMISLPGGSRPG